MQETTSKPHNGAETMLETLDQVENRKESAHERNGNRATAQKPCRRHHGSRAFFSTGQAAQELGTSIPKVRALCETGMIHAEVTSGNQWRVPVLEVERLKREGLPPISRPMPWTLVIWQSKISRKAFGSLPKLHPNPRLIIWSYSS